MNICFLARPCYDVVSVSIYDCIKKNFDALVQGYFITMNNKETKYIMERVSDATVYEISDYFQLHWDEFTTERLKEYEIKYDCEPVWSYIYTDRFLIKQTYEYTVKTTIGLFSFFEFIYSNNNIDFYYSENIATLLCYISYIVGKKHGVKYVTQTLARGLDATHHFISNNPFENNVKLDNNYQKNKYSDEELKKADKFLARFEGIDVKPAYMLKAGVKPRFKIRYLMLPIKRFIMAFSPDNRNKYIYIYYQSSKSITNPLIFYIKYQISKKYYHNADYSKKYVYFPLHYQPEASTIVCAPKYEKQLFYIDSWAKSIPADTLLYVKEHYAVLGHRDLQFYKELKKYPNVVLIDPYESSRKLIENAIAVTTLTGTAGWEAMLLRKPVFIGGNIFYENAPGVIKINDIYQNYMSNIEKWSQPSREEILAFLCAYFRSISLGSVISIYENNPPDKDNIKNVSKSLYTYLLGELRNKKC